MDDLHVDIVGKTSTHYKVQKTFGNKIYSKWIKKEDVEIL